MSVYCEINVLHHNGGVITLPAYGLKEAKAKCQDFYEKCPTWPAFRIDNGRGYYCGIVDWSNHVDWLGWGMYKVMTTYEFYAIWKNVSLETAILNARRARLFGNDTDVETIEKLIEMFDSALNRSKLNQPGTLAVEVLHKGETSTVAYNLRNDAQAKAIAQTQRLGLGQTGEEYQFLISDQFNEPYLKTISNPKKGRMKWLKA